MHLSRAWKHGLSIAARIVIGGFTMHIYTLAFALLGLSSTAFAANPPLTGPALELGDVVATMESRYPAKVVAIQLDASGDKPTHYHVDLRFAEDAIAKLDVDAATLQVSAREASELSPVAIPLVHATALIMTSIPGQLLRAELDATNGVAPHYDVDVKLPQGAIARLKVDATTRQIGWRTPAIISD
jgi:uncharacterized membrane protein YkoI